MERFYGRKARRVMWVLFGIGMLVMLTLGLAFESALWFGLGIFLAGFGVLILFWRCPSCRSMLPKGQGGIRYCPHCGEKID